MGAAHLQNILKIFVGIRGPQEPAAIIQDATLFQQQSVMGMTCNLYDLAKKSPISSSAVIAIGRVVNEIVDAKVAQTTPRRDAVV